MNSIMIPGGYGHFGVKIAEALINDNIPIVIVGRNQHKASGFNIKGTLFHSIWSGLGKWGLDSNPNVQQKKV